MTYGKPISRRAFLGKAMAATALCWTPLPSLGEPAPSGYIMAVTGDAAASSMGLTLAHEHILVDFIGATQTGYHRWARQSVVKKVLPYLEALKAKGCQTLVECTPAYLGRDPLLLRELSERTGLTILTNTGYYGARNNQFIPPHGFTESAVQLADRWVKEWKNGIDGTGVRPGFMKIGVDAGPLSPLHQKLVKAAAKAHLQTGLPIYIHTGPALPAFEEMDILEAEGVDLSAYVWVHAQVEQDMAEHVKAAKRGAWVSLDGVSASGVVRYVSLLNVLKAEGLLNRVLLSHDAGWYTPGEPDGGNFRGYTELFDALLPELQKQGFTDLELELLLIKNPAEALTIKVRKK